MAKAQHILYAAVGAGEAAVEKAAELRKLTDAKTTTRLYGDFVKRGRTVTKKIRSSAPTKRAMSQTRTARSQVKAAATSVGKAVRANVDATRSVGRTVRRAS